MNAQFDIRLALTDQDRRAIGQLRRQGNREASIASGSRRGVAALCDPNDDGAYVFGVFDGDRAVASIRLHLLSESTGGPDANELSLAMFGQYYPNHMGVVSSFVVAQHIERDADVVARLTQQVICVGYLHRLEFICGAFGAPWLPMMETLGWRRYLHLSACPNLRDSAPLCFVLSDAPHLRKVGSPHAALAAAFGRNQFAAAHFRQIVANGGSKPASRRQANAEQD